METKSNLVDVVNHSPYNSGTRKNNVQFITPHIAVAQWTAERIAEYFCEPDVDASANYGIGCDGKVAEIVPETKRAWTSSSAYNDNRAITIECASNRSHPYAMYDCVYSKLIELMADICQRYGKNKVIWIPEKEKAFAYANDMPENEMLITAHRWYVATECPGEWLYNKLGTIAELVNQRLAVGKELYCVQVGAYSTREGAEATRTKLTQAGFTDNFIVKKVMVK